MHQIKIPRGQELHLYVGAIGPQAIYGSDDSSAFSEILLRAGTEGEPSYQLEDELTNQLLPIFQRMHQEILSNQPFCQQMFITKFTEALILLERGCFAKNDNETHRNPKHKKGKMWEIILYVYQHFRDDMKLESLAERFYVSVPHISTSFKPIIGDNFHDFLEKIRISHACSLLISSHASVITVGFEVGFTSYSTFSRVFKERLNMSPSAYRKLNQGSNFKY
ncbi:hypothetical protein A8709_30575 [Paenibacillus pectinilyticus]|uniref:HTH araC/xylS-type domain-containing protein n=1 Tax=Paenibacillus pectinilyticus TaxID=512399 RepID=A0A1C0ZVR0_9BACL|nr:AraC family transcriptional regulator [Paenibacillus pectinilyticus]OCT12192.1 hypothetical protein A8709_30575 [Paenibacillus pectinilyticus]